MPSAAEHGVLLEYIVIIARQIGIEVDLELTNVSFMQGWYHITVTCATIPDCEDARTMMESALHCALVEEFQGHNLKLVVCTPAVQRMVPPASETRFHASEWIRAQQQGILEWATLCAQYFSKGAYERVIESYPWKEATRMRALVPGLCLHSMANLQNGKYDRVMSGDVDDVLPPLHTLVPPEVQQEILSHVETELQKAPESLLQTYETVFDLVRDKKAPRAVLYLFEQVFEF